MKKVTDVEWTDIHCVETQSKKIRITVNIPYADIKVHVPKNTSEQQIFHVLSLHKMWIEKQKHYIRTHYQKPEYRTETLHYVRGKLLPLSIVENSDVKSIRAKVTNDFLYILIPKEKVYKESDIIEAIEKMHRQYLKKRIPEIIPEFEEKLSVKASSFGIRHMKTRWGTCNTLTKKIWLNLELAKYPDEVLQYVIAHELVHLRERGHTKVFYRYLEECFNDYKKIHKMMNKQPNTNRKWYNH